MKQVIAYILFLAFTPLTWLYSIVGLVKSPHVWKKYFPFFVIAVFVFSYSYNPVSQIDLVEYFKDIDYCARVSLNDAMIHFSDGLFIRTIIFWIIGRMGLPHLVPAISTSIVYGIAIYITCDSASRYMSEKLIPYVLIFQIMLLPFNSIVSNVRNVCSFSLIVLAVYLEFIKKKKIWKVLPLYILPCFIHTSSVLLVVLRIIAPYIKKKDIIVAGTVPLVSIIIRFLYDHLSLFSFGGYFGISIQTMIRKVYFYMIRIGVTEKRILISDYYSVTKMVTMPLLVILMILLFYRKRVSLNEKREESYLNFIFLMCITAVASGIVFIVPHYWRITCAVIVAFPIVLIPLINNLKFEKIGIKIIIYSLPIFMIIKFALDMYRGAINIKYGDFILQIFQNNIFVIIFRFVQGIFRLFF